MPICTIRWSGGLTENILVDPFLIYRLQTIVVEYFQTICKWNFHMVIKMQLCSDTWQTTIKMMKGQNVQKH